MKEKVIDFYCLKNLCADIFKACGLSDEDAFICADILVTSDARAIKSHGVARIDMYVDGIKNGGMNINAKVKTIRETKSSFVLDADGSVGLSLSKKSMDRVIEMAEDSGFAFCSISNSNHFGIAAYYSEMAAKKDMIGIAMTNTASLAVPTFAKDTYFGTNPIAFAAPALDNKMFSLDMATTCVPRGKIEVYLREGKKLPVGWAVGKDGLHTDDAKTFLDDTLHKTGGGLLPLGGEGEMFSGHKGYGLAALVDIMTAVTSGGVFGKYIVDCKENIARVCHFFAAFKIEMFRDTYEFKKDMTKLLDDLNNMECAKGYSRVYYAGQKEHEAFENSLKNGVVLETQVWENILTLAEKEGVNIKKYLAL